jgi:2-phospho-L-lactate guanylyltransferase
LITVTTEAIVVPLKRFDLAKNRLRIDPHLNVTALSEELARGVITSCQPRQVVVLSEDIAVAHFATSLGADVWSSRATNLNEAVHDAYRGLAQRFERLIIVHGDLAHPDGLGTFIFETGVTIFTDHHGEGTNVLALSTNMDFHFAYGPTSRRLHVEECERLGVNYRVVTDSPWRFDVDEPSDVESP